MARSHTMARPAEQRGHRNRPKFGTQGQGHGRGMNAWGRPGGNPLENARFESYGAAHGANLGRLGSDQSMDQSRRRKRELVIMAGESVHITQGNNQLEAST